MRRGEQNARKVECEERGKAECGAEAKLQPHFKLDLGLFCSLGLMAMHMTIFSLVTTYIDAHNLFFIVTTYTNTHSFTLSPLTTYNLNLNPSHIHIWAWISYPPWISYFQKLFC